jgi:hypothetical protein
MLCIFFIVLAFFSDADPEEDVLAVILLALTLALLFTSVFQHLVPDFV